MHTRISTPLLLGLLVLAVAALTGCASAGRSDVPGTPPTFPTPRAAPGAAQGSASERLQRLFEDEWERTLRESPLTATGFGDRRYNDRLPSVGLADQQRSLEADRAALARLLAIPRDSLPPEDAVNYDVFRRIRENGLAAAEFRGYLIPITNREGFHTSFPDLPERVPLATVEDYENYVARLRAFRAYAGQHVELMREGIRQGMVLPRISVQGIDESLTPHIVDDPSKSLLYRPFTRFPAGVPDSARARLERAGRDAIATSVVPGYRDFLEFMRREYVPAARTTIGASELPNGRAFYAARARNFTTLDLTPDQIHQVGLAEVARIRAEMDSVMRSTGFRGTFPEFVQFLRTDPRFYAESPEELLRYTSLVLKRMDGELPRLFGRLPRLPYGIKQIPDYIAPRTTTAYYMPGSPDGTRAGAYFVNVHDLKSRPLYEVESLSFHEAVPGHHLQIALAQELPDVPNFRRTAGFTAFVEGWALYSESLGKEVGFYQDPYSYFGHLTYDAWRATRLVVDTGIHDKGWRRQQAIDYMAANTGLTLLNITNEVDRYIAWPGQALGYKMGQLKIRELRSLAERELGGDFDLRAFHDVVLGSGAIPLDVLEANVRAWIAREKARE
ncbi:MAG TPA: DUF885 domain-containing protein [Longimicrobiaceae bacterium]|nr:DUF885 domain-containing protein [Longimicrobiaceae bacterium]